jgi:hypothetical protein
MVRNCEDDDHAFLGEGCHSRPCRHGVVDDERLGPWKFGQSRGVIRRRLPCRDEMRLEAVLVGQKPRPLGCQRCAPLTRGAGHEAGPAELEATGRLVHASEPRRAAPPCDARSLS